MNITKPTSINPDLKKNISSIDYLHIHRRIQKQNQITIGLTYNKKSRSYELNNIIIRTAEIESIHQAIKHISTTEEKAKISLTALIHWE